MSTQIEKAAQSLAHDLQTSVLIKSGHFVQNANDYFYNYPQKASQWFNQSHINNPNTHGTGCTLSSAIASYLAMDNSLDNAIKKGKNM